MLFGKRERAIRRILIVEDEPLVAFDNEHLLRECGYEVVATVDTLAEAVRVLFVTANCPLEARGLGIGCLAKPYTDKVLKGALDALDRKLSGKKVGRLP